MYEESVIHSSIARLGCSPHLHPRRRNDDARTSSGLSRKECGDGGRASRSHRRRSSSGHRVAGDAGECRGLVHHLHLHSSPSQAAPATRSCLRLGWATHSLALDDSSHCCSPITNKQPSILGLRRDEKGGGEACMRSQSFIHFTPSPGLCRSPPTTNLLPQPGDDSSHCIRLWSVCCSPTSVFSGCREGGWGSM